MPARARPCCPRRRQQPFAPGKDGSHAERRGTATTLAQPEPSPRRLRGRRRRASAERGDGAALLTILPVPMISFTGQRYCVRGTQPRVRRALTRDGRNHRPTRRRSAGARQGARHVSKGATWSEQGWTYRAPREAIRPRFFIDEDAAPGGALAISGAGNEHAFGYWARAYPITGGRSYRLRASFRFEGLEGSQPPPADDRPLAHRRGRHELRRGSSLCVPPRG